MKKSIYKSAKAREIIQNLYDKKLKSLDFPFEEIDVNTSFGRTRVVKTGNEKGKKIVLFHGVHAGAPLTLESTKGLRDKYQLYAIETIGQATQSDETVLDINDDSFAIWADEVLDGLSITKANFVGISYGAFILQKLITHRPVKVETCVFVVPSGLANGAFWPSMTKLTFPLLRFMMTKSDKDLRKFISPFVNKDDTYMFEFQKAIMLGLNMDFRRPSILQKKDVENFDKPVYMIVAESDIFFPGDASVAQAKKVFNQLKEVHVLKGSKHMPGENHLQEIQEKIESWVG